MQDAHHHFSDLFAQLGLPNDAKGIAQFLAQHRPLAGDVRLPLDEQMASSQIWQDSPDPDYQILATELGMTTLVEVHSVDNLCRMLNHVGFPHAGYSLLGVNNRISESVAGCVAGGDRAAERGGEV